MVNSKHNSIDIIQYGIDHHY